jgi:hypothetical protein
MSNTCRGYRAIKQGILQCYEPYPRGHHEKHLNTLVALICGLVRETGSFANHCWARSCPRIGQQSLTKHFQRWLQNSHSSPLPDAKALFVRLAQHVVYRADQLSTDPCTAQPICLRPSA